MPPYTGYNPSLARAFEAITLPQSGMTYIGNFLVSQILERHPKLKVVFGGASAGWINFILETTDYAFGISGNASLGYERKPSETFQRQCYVVGTYDDRVGLRHACDSPGAQSVLWGTEFPLAVSTWPDTRRYLGAACASLSDAERKKILMSNAAELYKINKLIDSLGKWI